jgi:PGF-pre-PGF domain-containing protein
MSTDTDIDYPSGTKNGIEGDNKVIIMSCEAGKEQCTMSPLAMGHTYFTSNFYNAFTTARSESNSDIQQDKISLEEAFNYAKQKTTSQTKFIPTCYQNPQMMDHFPTKSDNTDQCYFSESSISPDFLTALTDCPVHLHAYDSEGRHTGVTSDGNGIEEEISGSFYNGPTYDPEEIIVLGNPDNIRYEIKAFDKGIFNFTVTKSTEEEITKIKYENISITSNTTATLLVDYSNPKYVMQIDDNGDGVEDRSEEPDEITVTGSENQESSDESSSDSSRSSSSSSSSSGGGGGGGSPEPAKNVEVKELAQTFITNGKEAKFEFRKNATCIVYVNFDAKRNLGKTTTIVEQLKGKSALVSALPEGEVYKSFNVWVGNGGIATSENIENPALCFKVEKSWLQNNSVDPASITLNRYSDEKWEQFNVNMSGEDTKYLYFTADVSGFSSFAITGKAKSTSEENDENLSATRSVESTDEADDNGTKSETEKSAPGFEMIFGILCLLGVFLFRRK